MGRTRQRSDSSEWALCSAIDKLNEFDRYEADVLPLLRRAAKERWPSSRIRQELASLSQALIVQQGLAGNINRSSQLAAIRDVLDRYEGKPRRRVSKAAESMMSKADLVEMALRKLRAIAK